MATEPRAGASSSPPPLSLSDVGQSAARYLYAISVLSESDTDRIATGELREYLDVAPASVTGMVSKLDDRGLVDREKYQGVTLTARGQALATEAGWRFCVVSSFFESTFDVTIDDETAFDIGVALPKDGVFRLREFVDSACLGRCPTPDNDPKQCMA